MADWGGGISVCWTAGPEIRVDLMFAIRGLLRQEGIGSLEGKGENREGLRGEVKREREAKRGRWGNSALVVGGYSLTYYTA